MIKRTYRRTNSFARVFHLLILGIMLYGATQVENRETILTLGLPFWHFMTMGGLLVAYIGHRNSLRYLIELLEEKFGTAESDGSE